MVAYVAGNLVLLPLLEFSSIKYYWDGMNQGFLMGIIKGILFRAGVSLITVFLVKRK
jgi:hypothetical protein